MLSTIFCTLLLLSIFFLTGAGLTFRIIGESNFFFPISIIFGFSILIYFSWLRVIFGYWVIPLACLALASLGILSLKWISRINFQKKSLLTVVFFLPGFMISALSQFTGLVYQGLRLRTGPDFLGWIVASNYFQTNEQLDFLNQSLTKQLGSSELFFSSSPSSSVYSIPSYTEQVQAEFLLGSERIGITSFVGFSSRISVLFDSKTLLVSLVSLFAGVTSIILFQYLKKIHARIKTQILVSSLSIGSASLLAPIFEGGIWHILIIPIILLLIINLVLMPATSENFKLDLLLVGILSSLVISISTDVMLISGPICLAILIKYVRAQQWTHILGFFPLTLLLVPGLSSISNSLKSRQGDMFVGGWSATSIGLPGDFIGLTPWQTPTGFYDGNEIVNTSQLIIGIFATLFALLIFIGSESNIKQILLPYFLSLVIIYSFFYVNLLLSDNRNHYLTWKLAFLWSLPFCILIPSFFSHRHESKKKLSIKSNLRFNFLLNHELKISIESFFLSWSIILCGLFFSQWSENSKVIPFSVGTHFSNNDQNKISTILKKYEVNQVCIPWVTSLALYGDLHLTSERRAGTNVKSTMPPREEVIIIQKSLPRCLGLKMDPLIFTQIAKIAEYTFFVKKIQ